MAGKGGGAWKVAYADFVTAMMAFFLVMWITAQNKPVKEAIAAYFEDPTSTTMGSGSVRQNVPPPESLMGAQATGRGPGKGPSKGASLSPRAKGEPKGPPPRLRLFQRIDQTRSVGTMVLFNDNSTELDDLAQVQLGALVPQLLGKPNKIEIRGHAPSAEDANESAAGGTWQLCFDRCLATMEFLVSKGLDRNRIRLSLAGSSEPYSQRRDPEWRAHNSRVEVFALSEYSQPFEPPTEARTGLFRETDMRTKRPVDAAPVEEHPPAEPAHEH
jgi:chemotaxis protein MotB